MLNKCWIVAVLVAVLLIAQGCALRATSTTELEKYTAIYTKQHMDAMHYIDDVAAQYHQEGEVFNSDADEKKCEKCMTIATIVDDMLKKASTAAILEDVLDDVCVKELKNKTKKDIDTCKDVVKIVVKLGEFLAVKGWHYMIPNAVCADIMNYCQVPCCSASDVPEQLHLSFASQQVLSNNTAMQVTWVTLKSIDSPFVEWVDVSSTASTKSTGSSRTYNRGGWVGNVHGAIMEPLQPGRTYKYRVGGMNGTFSTWRTFQTLPLDAGTSSRPLRYVFIADMGYDAVSNSTINAIQEGVENGEVDFVVHSGDIGYADSDEPKWDVWGRKIEGITSRVPYMTVPGNHEFLWNFTAYKARYWTPKPTGKDAPLDAMYYRFDVGPLSFVMLDSETWINTPNIDAQQREWAKIQMQEINAGGNFLIVSHHRPLYASQGDMSDMWDNILRSQVEDLYMAEKVRLVMYGHVHNYERTFPMYNDKAISTSLLNPSAPMYLLNGAAGQNEGQDTFRENNTWTASRSTDIGYSTFQFDAKRRPAPNDTASEEFQLVSTFVRSSDRAVLDRFNMTVFV